MTNTYQYFDDIVCITLDISQERREHAKHYFDKLGIPARFHVASKHKLGGLYGCFDSHIYVIKEAYEKGLNNLLVFEDDVLPTCSYSEEKISEVIDFMQSNDDWDIMYFGYNVIKDDINGFSTIFSGKYCTRDIVQYNPFCTHALCYSRRAMEKILQNYQDFIGIVHYDMFLASYLELTNFCVTPMLFDQNFYFEHNNQSNDGLELLLRTLFPVLAISKLNYRISKIKYWCNKYKKIVHYFNLFLLSLVMYKLKTSLIYSQKLYL